jgi:hypothetical protein
VRRRAPARTKAELLLGQREASLLDLVDHVLNKGVVLEGEVLLGLADVDLVYLRLAALLCSADRAGPRPGAGDGARRRRS